MDKIGEWGKVGERIREARMALGITQEEIGDALNITRAAVSLWEKGTTMPERKYWAQLAEMLHISDVFLLTGKGPGPRKANPKDVIDKRKITRLRLRSMIEEGRFDDLIMARIEHLLREGKLDDKLRRLRIDSLIQDGKLDDKLRQFGYRRTKPD
jgi:transcriptional regulator with XRE-family HTH domain